MLASTTPKARTRSRRQALLTGAAIALAMTALARAPRAHAQAFQGTPSVVNGSVSIITEGSGTLLTVNTPQAVINWAPNDTAIGGAPINFLPAGATATYENSTNISDFTVLNRIIPTDQTRGVAFNGTVLSRVTDSGGVTRPGGAVWFYVPGGIIAGPSAVFDVGSLLLTTNDIDFTNGLFGDGANSTRGTIRFRGAAGSTAAVQIQMPATITARNQALGNAYVALVAPRVLQDGTIDVLGSAALVAAEQADVTIRANNLFDINVTVGTTVANAISHNGLTGGPSQGFGAGNSIYMTTVAKNDAVTILLGGVVGYSPAATATVDNGAIVLSAGYDIVNGAIAATPDNANTANITIANTPPAFTSTTLRSDVTAHATGAVLVSPTTAGGTVSFASDANLFGDSSASASALLGGTIAVAGDLTLTSRRGRLGGSASLIANGTVTIGGDLKIDASGFGLDNLTPGVGVGEDASGGSALLRLDAGTISVRGNTQVLADGTPGVGALRSGNGTGGLASVVVNGNLTLGDPQNPGNGDLVVSARGLSADRSGFFFLTANGGAGTGGRAELRMNSGTLDARLISLDASGAGSSGGFAQGNALNGAAGAGAGGAAEFIMSGGTVNADELDAFAFAQAGFSSFLSSGANAQGGTSSVLVSGGSLNVLNFIEIDSSAFSSGGNTVGEASGGTATLSATGTGAIDADFLSLRASAFADSGNATGGDAFGGNVVVETIGGAITTQDFNADADASGGDGDAAGQAIGGNVTMRSSGAGSFSSAFGGFISVDGFGGRGNQGGDGSGGIVTLLANGGALSFGDPDQSQFEFLTINAMGNGGISFDGDPNSGGGGIIDIRIENNGSLSFDQLDAEADGNVFNFGEGFSSLQAPPEPSAGSGGIGMGGEVTFTITSGTVNGGFLELQAEGEGGPANSSGPGGDGVGGTVIYDQQGGTVTLQSLQIDTDGQGGRGAFGDADFAPTAGGNGFGGTGTLTATGGTLTVSDITISTEGQGGEGGRGFDVNSANGGDGYGGRSSLTVNGADVTANFIFMEATGEGGAGGDLNYDTGGEGGVLPPDFTFNDRGGDGGIGHGGSTTIQILSGSFANDFMEANANGFGGEGGGAFGFFFGQSSVSDPDRGGTGGTGMGGEASVRVALSGTTLNGVGIEAEGVGGEGGFGMVGGAGGLGMGGTSAFTADGAEVRLEFLALDSEGDGGDGRHGFVVDGGDGGDGVGGSSILLAQGADALLTLSSLELDSTGDGGDGGFGGGGEGFTVEFGGDGGAGGDGAGGTAELIADLGSIVLETGYGQGFAFFDAGGEGGFGGDGGNGTAPGVSGGVGGAGGLGTGGIARLNALAGSIASGNWALNADGVGGEGGFGGFGPFDPGNPEAVPPIPPSGPFQSANGAAGIGSGGLVQVRAEDNPEINAFGRVNLGFVELSAMGDSGFFFSSGADVGGRVEISDLGALAEGSISFAGLEITTRADVADDESGVAIFSGAGAIRVFGSAFIDSTGEVTIDAMGTGGLDVDGGLSIFADGAVGIQHQGRPTDASTIEAQALSISSSDDILAGAGTQLSTDFSLDLTSSAGSVEAARLLSGIFITARALGDVSIGDALSSGTTSEGFGSIEIVAGFNGFSEGGSVLVPADATITGMVSASDVSVLSGRDVVVGDGASVTGDELLEIYATRDIVGLGSLIAPGTLNIGVGEDLSIGTIDVGDELNTIDANGFVTDFGRLVVPGELTIANLLIHRGGDLDVEATAISIGTADASGSMLLTSSSQIELGSALADGTIALFAENSVDVGTAQAGRGGEFGNLNIFSNAIEGDFRIEIDQASATGDISIIGIAPGNGANLDAGVLDAVGSVFVDMSGDATIDMAFSDAVIEGEGISGIVVNASGNVDIGSATAAANIFVNGGGNVLADSLSAGMDIDLNAGNDATIGSARAGGGSGQSGMFVVEANANSAFGGTPLDSLAVEQGGTITVMSSTNDLWSAGPLPRISDGNGLVATRLATASDDSGQTPGTQIGANFGPLNAGGFSAPFGALVGEVGGQRVLLGANGQVTAPASGTLRLSYWDSNAGDNTGNISFALSTGTPPPIGSGEIRLNAGRNLNVTTAIAGGDIDLNAGMNTTVGMAQAGLDLDINAGAATSVMIARSLAAEVDINAGSSTTVGLADAAFDVDINAGTATNVTTAIAGDDIFLNAGTTLVLGTGTADETVDLNAGDSMTVGTINAGDDIFLSSGDSITAQSLTAGYEIDVFANTDVTIGSATTLGLIGDSSSFDIDIFTDGSIDLGDASSAGSIFLGAEGNIRAGNLIADEEIELDAGGDIDVVSALTTGLGGESGYGTGGEGFFFNDITAFAGGDIDIGTADSAGNIGIEALGSVDADTLIARGLDDSDDDLEGAIGVGAEGNVTVGSATATRDIGLASLFGDVSAGTLNAGSDVLMLAADDIQLGSATAGGLVYLGGPQLIGLIVGGEGFGGFDEFADLDVVGNLLVNLPPLPAGGSVNATGLITAANLVAAAQEGVSLARTDIAQNARFFAGQGIVVSTDLGVDGVVNAIGGDIDFTSLGALTLDSVTATNGDVRVTSAQNLQVDEMRSAGDIRLTSTAGSVILGDVSTQPNNSEEGVQGALAITPDALGSPGPGDIIVTAALDISTQNDVDARRNLTMDAGRVLDIDSLVHGVEIRLESADIGIDDEGGQVGRATTTTNIRFTNGSAGTQTFIGGADSGSAGYRLSGAEIGRVFGRGDITIVAPGSTSGSQPDVVLGTMTVRGQTGTGEQAGQIANGGRFRVETPGRLAITGDVDFVGLSDTARVELDADQQISLAAETGSLSIRGAGNALAGELLLSSNLVIAGTADAIADVAAASSTDAIDDRLGQAEGTANDDGFFAARGMRVQVASGFFVQNSGASAGTTPADRRGFTVGAGGLNIQTSSASTRIVINGRRLNADGSFTSGADLIPTVQISSGESATALFDTRSTINGCLISGGASCTQPVLIDPSVSVRDIPLLSEEPGTSSAGGDPGEGSAFPTALVTFADFESFGFEPLIDEPVTGAGNDDLWLSPDEDQNEDEDEDENPE